MTAKPFALLLAAALAAVAGAQSWSRAYDAGLAAARAGKWAEARASFQEAVAGRPEDQATPTVLPGPATERKLWRNGAPYSPNFLAAYARYRQGLATADPVDGPKMMREAAGELETLVAKGQTSAEAFFFLDVIYTKLGDAEKRRAAQETATKAKTTFKVDTEPVAPEEMGAMGARTSGPVVQPGTGVTVNPGVPFGAGPTVTVNGNVAPLADKFALVIGQSESRLPGLAIPYSASDAARVRDALVSFAGYPADNVQTLQNATAAQIKAAAEALAARMGDGSTVTIYYSGAGVNLAGKDYLAGTDAESASDAARMLAKTDLFAPFVQRGARVFAFFQANRPLDGNGAYFGREKPEVGSISQMEATVMGSSVTPTYRDGQAVGLFTNAFCLSLANLRANRVPIYEFAWQVVNRMRRGDTGNTGGGGSQVCTLPVYTNLASDSKF